MGGLCLGPVNTCGVHALSYGLAGKYHMSHGLANALLLPEVLRFNKPNCLARFGAMAKEIGLPYRYDNQQNADAVIDEFLKNDERVLLECLIDPMDLV